MRSAQLAYISVVQLLAAFVNLNMGGVTYPNHVFNLNMATSDYETVLAVWTYLWIVPSALYWKKWVSLRLVWEWCLLDWSANYKNSRTHVRCVHEEKEKMEVKDVNAVSILVSVVVLTITYVKSELFVDVKWSTKSGTQYKLIRWSFVFWHRDFLSAIPGPCFMHLYKSIYILQFFSSSC